MRDELVMASNTTPDQATKPPVKRSLFNRPAWSKPAEKAKEEDPANIFFRSKEVYAQILKEDDRRLQKKIEKRVKPNRRSKGSNKRRRSNSQTDDDNLKEVNESSSEDDSDDQLPRRRPLKSKTLQYENTVNDTSRRPPPPPPPDDAYKPKASSKSLSRRYEEDVIERAKELREKQAPFGYILVSEDEDDVVIMDNAANSYHQNVKSSNETAAKVVSDGHSTPTSDVEEEFPELARRAREKARLKAIAAKTATTEPTAQGEGSFTGATTAQARPVEPTLDPVVSILITSRLANTKPLIVNRKIGQRLKDVRITWCRRQGFNEDQTDEICLTWKGRRVYDMTTCKNLGISVDTDGNVTWRGHEDDIEGSKEVHMEALTKDMLQEMEKSKINSFTYGAAEIEDQGICREPEVEAQPKADEPRVKLILKSQGYEDKSLTVRPDTTMEKIINAFRTARNVPAAKRVFLQFDGENLDPRVTVAQTELSDMDYVDVYVK